jgi:hypothetical protein
MEDTVVIQGRPLARLGWTNKINRQQVKVLALYFVVLDLVRWDTELASVEN